MIAASGRGKLRILVAVDVPAPEQISQLLIELQRPLKVCLLGTYSVPEQTAPEQAREQHGEKASSALDEVADAFRATGIEVETELVFTPDVLDAVERTAVDRGCHAILLLEPVYRMERILAALRPGPLATRIARLLADLLRGTDLGATLLHVIGEDDDPDRARRELERLKRELIEEGGVDAGQVETRLEVDDDPEDVVAGAASEHDVVLIGETEPSLRDAVLGDFSRRLADDADTPVIVVRREL